MVLPINSFLNPLIYDKTVITVLVEMWTSIRNYIINRVQNFRDNITNTDDMNPGRRCNAVVQGSSNKNVAIEMDTLGS